MRGGEREEEEGSKAMNEVDAGRDRATPGGWGIWGVRERRRFEKSEDEEVGGRNEVVGEVVSFPRTMSI